MTTWVYYNWCKKHDRAECDCDPIVDKYDLWRLTSDQGLEMASIQRFDPEGPFYGNTGYGRTGAMNDLVRCQAKCELMLQNQKGPFDK